ncbi:MAG: dihydrofolate reductase family protein [Pseudomonadota bacterium]
MQTPVTRLYPAPGGQHLLEGLYLQHRLHRQPDSPFVYSNFITSLDGRISLGNNDNTTHTVPAATVNPRDWRLYQELAGQADLLITSGRYFRQSLIGEAQDQLPVGNQAEFTDIREWRLAQGLPPQPDIAILSGSLEIPIAALEPYRHRRILIITGETADQTRIDKFQASGLEVVRAGTGIRVDGRRMISQLATLGYRSICAIAGPAVFYTLLDANVINRLYLTIAQQLLGGEVFDTLTRGPLLTPARGMSLISLYHDPYAPAGAGQLFGVFEPRD